MILRYVYLNLMVICCYISIAELRATNVHLNKRNLKHRRDMDKYRGKNECNVDETRPERKYSCKAHLQQINKDFYYECRPGTLWYRKISGIGIHSFSNFIPIQLNSSRNDSSNHVDFIFNQTCGLLIVRNATAQWNIPKNISSLRLYKQGIAELLDDSFFDLRKSLRYLRLDSNVITFISNNAFRGLSQVMELDLSYNSLREFPTHALADLVNLKILKLSHNEIQLINRNSLVCLNYLTYLDVSNNLLSDVHANAFHHVTGPQSFVVNLRRNRLSNPKSNWLFLPISKKNSCPKSEKNFIGSYEMINLTYTQSRTRILWGNGNPWQCSCLSSSEPLKFLKTLISMRHPSEAMLLINEENANDLRSCSNILKENYEIGLDFTIPCVDLKANMDKVDLGNPLFATEPVYNNCCSSDWNNVKLQNSCRFVDLWLKKYFSNNYERSDDSEGLTDGQVTVIGILIVILSPVLLTLCPDCNKSKSKVRYQDEEESTEILEQPKNIKTTKDRSDNILMKDMGKNLICNSTVSKSNQMETAKL